MKSIIILLPVAISALSAPLSRRNAITGSLAAAAVPGASNAAPSAAVIGYDDVVLDLPCGARVPACVWLPSDGTDAPPASYKYRISAGRLVKTILGLPTPDAIARTFALDAPGVREAPGASVKDGTPVVVVAHGFLGTRFDLSKFGEALAREGAVAIAPDFDETLAGSYTPDKDGGSSRDKIVVAALEPVWKSKFYGVVLHAIDATPARWREHPTHWLISTQVRACEAARGHWQHRLAGPQRRRGNRVESPECQGCGRDRGLRPGRCRRRTIPRDCERRRRRGAAQVRPRAVPRRREKH
jgi:hypothetical protein